MRDDEIDTSDIPPLDEAFFANAEIRMPQTKPSITIRLDPEVLEWFKDQGRGYQTRINSVLRRYVETQKRSGGAVSHSPRTRATSSKTR